LIPDLDIYRAAKLSIDQHDQEAPIRAAERADDLLERVHWISHGREPDAV
jgi:hypothetical protein